MEKYILQAPNCWHQFNPRAALPRQIMLQPENQRASEKVAAEEGVHEGGEGGHATG